MTACSRRLSPSARLDWSSSWPTLPPFSDAASDAADAWQQCRQLFVVAAFRIAFKQRRRILVGGELIDVVVLIEIGTA